MTHTLITKMHRINCQVFIITVGLWWNMTTQVVRLAMET